MTLVRGIALGLGAVLLLATLFLTDYWQLGRTEPALVDDVERADAILVEKAARRLTLLRQGRALASYPVSLGFSPVGGKEREGDGRTPEGRYTIEWKNPQSVAYLSLKVSYPEPAEAAEAQSRGEPPGGDIMIHGIMNGYGWLGRLHRRMDWTSGCVAVTNDEMRAIYARVEPGTPIEIRP